MYSGHCALTAGAVVQTVFVGSTLNDRTISADAFGPWYDRGRYSSRTHFDKPEFTIDLGSDAQLAAELLRELQQTVRTLAGRMNLISGRPLPVAEADSALVATSQGLCVLHALEFHSRRTSSRTQLASSPST